MPLYQRTRVNKRVRRLELPLRWRWRWRRWWRLVLHHDDWLLRQLLLQLLPFGSPAVSNTRRQRGAQHRLGLAERRAKILGGRPRILTLQAECVVHLNALAAVAKLQQRQAGVSASPASEHEPNQT